MGVALARAARDRGAAVTLITTAAPPPDDAGFDVQSVSTAAEMYTAVTDGLQDQVVCLTTIDTPTRVRHLEQEMRRRHDGSIDLHCHKEFDPHWYILAVHDARATKDQGVVSIKRVQDLADCRVVVFGDQVNDIDMFRTADEAYAVAGAVPELAEHATAMIGSNDDDAVARWLEHRWHIRADSFLS